MGQGSQGEPSDAESKPPRDAGFMAQPPVFISYASRDAQRNRESRLQA
jgi:hypothetical protein